MSDIGFHFGTLVLVAESLGVVALFATLAIVAFAVRAVRADGQRCRAVGVRAVLFAGCGLALTLISAAIPESAVGDQTAGVLIWLILAGALFGLVASFWRI